jgi:endonuclease-3 related protein
MEDNTMVDFKPIYTRLIDHYGPQGWWPLIDRSSEPLRCSYLPEYSTMHLNSAQRFEICVGAILTQNTNWSNAEKALVNLLEAQVLDPQALSEMSVEAIARLIQPSGYYNQKARKLKIFSQFFLKNPPADRELFLSLWGLGPETVDDMLLYTYNQPIFVVDLYTKRLFSRLGFVSESISYHDLQSLITKGLPKDILIYKEFHALIVKNAKVHCSKKPSCMGCPLESLCPASKGFDA